MKMYEENIMTTMKNSEELVVGDIVQLGSDECIVIATANETDKGVLVRSLSNSSAGYLLPYVDYPVIRKSTITYEDTQKKEDKNKKKELIDIYMELGRVVGALSAEAMEEYIY